MSFDEIPNELLIENALLLDGTDLYRFCEVSTRFKSLVCDNNIFWRTKFRVDYGKREYDGLWKDLYNVYRFKSYTTEVQERRVVKIEEELCENLRHANLGFVAIGKFDENDHPVESTFRYTTVPLQEALFFLMPKVFGKVNPLYSIISHWNLINVLTLANRYMEGDDSRDRFMYRYVSDILKLNVTDVYSPLLHDKDVVLAKDVLQLQHDIIQKAYVYSNLQRLTALSTANPSI